MTLSITITNQRGEVKLDLELDEILELFGLVDKIYEKIKELLIDIRREMLDQKWSEQEALYLSTFHNTLRRNGIDPVLARTLTVLKVIAFRVQVEELLKGVEKISKFKDREEE